MRAIGNRPQAMLCEGTMTPEEIEQWPAMRGRTLRVIARSVLIKGALFGLVSTAVLAGVTAFLQRQFAGDTLDFGLFQIPGRVGGAVFPVLFHFWTFLPWAVFVSCTFFLLVGAGAWVTCETEFRRHVKSAERDGES